MSKGAIYSPRPDRCIVLRIRRESLRFTSSIEHVDGLFPVIPAFASNLTSIAMILPRLAFSFCSILKENFQLEP